ncbi:MAG: hypothetical protein K0Q73_6996 [Paenibacillus sp.]|nr:hypothetical protein [Paenibacillus sp.]
MNRHSWGDRVEKYCDMLGTHISRYTAEAYLRYADVSNLFVDASVDGLSADDSQCDG